MVAIIPVSPAPNPVGPDAEKVGEDALVATADGPTIRSMGLLPEGEIDPTKDAIFFRQRKYFIGESAGTVRVDVLRVGCLVSRYKCSARSRQNLTLVSLWLHRKDLSQLTMKPSKRSR